MTTPVFALPNGHARGVGVVVPTLKEPVTELVIVPQQSGITVAQPLNCTEDRNNAIAARLIDPIAIFLDSEKIQIGSVQFGTPAKRGNFGGRGFSVPAAAAYVVILHHPKALGERVEFAGDNYTTIMPVGGLFIPMPASGTIKGIRTSTGTVSATFR